MDLVSLGMMKPAMTLSELERSFRAFSDLTVVVIGDVMIDSYLWGRVDRISPEAPVPVVHVNKRENRLGGAANVALNLSALGAKTIVCGITGTDEKSALLKELLNTNGISPEGLFEVKNRPTTVKFRVLGSMQHLLRVDEEDDRPLSEKDQKDFEKKVLSLIDSQKCHAVVFEDYDKGTISPGLIQAVTGHCEARCIPVLVDPKRRNFSDYRNVSLFKPNYRELCEGLNILPAKNDPESIYKQTEEYRKAKSIRYLLITLSEHGIFISCDEGYAALPSEVREVSDVSGAGDTVIAVATLCLASGMKPADLAAVSNIAGGLVCERVGVVPAEKIALTEACRSFYGV